MPEHKIIPNFVLKADAAQGIVTHIFAVFGNVDLGRDVLHPGSFTKTINERGGKVKVLDQHNAKSVFSALGVPVEIREVGRGELPSELLDEFPEATGGVMARTQFLMDTPEGKGAFIRIKEGAIDEWSFAFDPLDVDFSKVEVDGEEVTVRNVRTVKLYEYGPVIFGMNEATTTVDAKDKEAKEGNEPDDDEKTVSGRTNLPLADRDREWDSSAAVQRIRVWAGATDEPNAKYKQAFFWYDGDEPENFTSYKLPFADVIDGELHAVPRGIFAVAGGRGVGATTGIPDNEKDQIKGKVNRYYARMRSEFDDDTLVSPFEKAGTDMGEPKVDVVKSLATSKAVNLGELVGKIELSFYAQYPDRLEPAEQRQIFYVREVWDTHLIVEERTAEAQRFYEVPLAILGGEVAFGSQDTWKEGAYQFVTLTNETETGPEFTEAGNEARPQDDASTSKDASVLEIENQLLELGYIELEE